MITAPFGTPVLPDVNAMYMTSDGLNEFASDAG